MKINWSLLGLLVTGIGFICDRMTEKEEEQEILEREESQNRQINELKARLRDVEAKLSQEVR